MSFGGQWYQGAQTQSAALKATQASIEQQKLLHDRLLKEQEDHQKLHDYMLKAEQDLLDYARRQKIVVEPTRIEKAVFGEKIKPARYISGPANAEFGRRLAEYQQKFQSHEGSNKRLTLLEEQILKERKQSGKVLKTARKITEKQAKAEEHKAEAQAEHEKAEAEKAKLEAKRIKRETPGAFEAIRMARVRKAQQEAEHVEAERQAAASRQALQQIREQEKQEKRLRKEQSRLDRQRAREVRVREHQKRVRQRQRSKGRKQTIRWRLFR